MASSPVPAPDPGIARGGVPGRRVLFIGLDGADWDLLDPLMAEGAMPNLAALVHTGRKGVLTTIHPPLSPLVWTTMMTGVGPLEHGVLDFTRFDPATGAREPITSAERRVPAIWNMTAAAGRSVAVLGLWATYPAEPVRGVVVSDRLFSFEFGEAEPPPGAVYPAARDGWARQARAAAEAETGYPALHAYLPWLEETEYRRALAEPNAFAQPVSALRRILVETAVYRRLAADLLSQSPPPDLTILYIQGTDAIGHLFAPYAPPRLPRVSPQDFARYSGVPRRYFAAIDGLLGEMQQLAERSGAVLFLASDHGFRWRDRPDEPPSFAAATAGRWHREEGISLLWGPGVELGPGGAGPTVRGDRASVKQVCATLLAILGMPSDPRLAEPPLAGAPGAAGSPRALPAVHYERAFRPAEPPAAAEAAPGDAEAVARLRALGYVGASEPARAPAGAPDGERTRTAGSYDNEGLILREAGRATEARAAFERALARDPRNASALWNLSDLLAAAGSTAPPASDLDRADDLLVKALAAGLPDGVARLRERALRYDRGGAGDRSVRLLAAGAAARPDDPELWLLAGRFRIGRRDCRAALDDFEHALQLAPRDAVAYGSSALARLCLGDLPGAAEDLRRSLALDPDQPAVRRALQEIPAISGPR
jgi:tetratricopeptide (TPR) repeat protein